MSLFALSRSSHAPSRDEVVDVLTGNLCRCTGYRSVIDAGLAACNNGQPDHFVSATKTVLELLSRIPTKGLQIDTGGQRYVQPATLEDCFEARRTDPAALVLCGATDVALRVTKKHEHILSIIDISGIPELRRIKQTADGIAFGAAVTMQDVLETARHAIPPLADMLRLFGSRQIRNLATIGGNVGTASPIGDALPVLMALQAEVELTGPRGTRRLPLEEMLVGYRATACQPDELITRVTIPFVPDATIVKSYKVSRRNDVDISTVSAGFRLERDEQGATTGVLLAFGGMAERTRRATRTEQFLTGKPWSRSVVEEAKAIVAKEFTPLGDVRGSAAFRTTIARNLLLKFWDDTSTSSRVPRSADVKA